MRLVLTHDFLQVEVNEQLVQVVGVCVHVVAVPWLTRSTVTTSVVGDHPAAIIGKEEHLVLLVIAVEWPSMREEDDWAGLVAPVFVEDLYSVRGSKGRHFDEVCLEKTAGSWERW
jgi:hypothetical protein